MRQSVDLKSSKELIITRKTRHANNISSPTGIARRAFLVLCVFLMSVGSAWGDPVYHNDTKIVSTNNMDPVSFSVNWSTIYADLGLTSWESLNSRGYIGWYVLDGNGGIVSCTFQGSANPWYKYNSDVTNSSNTFSNATYMNWASSTAADDYQRNFSDPGNQTAIGSVTITPSVNWKGLTVYAVITNDQTDFTGDPTKLTSKKVIYTWTLIFEDELADTPFTHYKGESGRDWVKPDGSNGSMEQKIWNSSTNAAEDFTGDIRQGVHTWDYYLYLRPGEERILYLPFENYNNSNPGNALEPRGFIRWYDYKTDQAVVNESGKYTFEKVGTALNNNTRGLIAFNLGSNPTHSLVGVKITAESGLKEMEIACDVSKYADGISTIGSNSYLIHEPTLSNRYLFHIQPASVIADKIATTKTNLANAEAALIDLKDDVSAMRAKYANLEYTRSSTSPGMFATVEDDGKVVVSLGSSNSGSFALRLNGFVLDDYVIYNASSALIAPNYIKWVAYYEGAEGIGKKQLGDATTNFITTLSYSNFIGNYTKLGSTETISVTETNGKKFHVIAFVGEGSSFDPVTGTGNYAPVKHYEINFIQAPPINVSDLKTNETVRNANIDRTDEYMTYNYDLRQVVDFDGNPETNSYLTSGRETADMYYSTTTWDAQPTTASNNIAWTPRLWEDIQYAYSYPNLVSQIKNGMNTGVSPEHGDYVILKSMNVTGVSKSEDASLTPNYYWWNTDELYDYTHTYTDGSKYGSFLYTDASNESRTMVTIPFTSKLCSGSTVFFTMAVADKTSNYIKPQLLVRVLAVQKDGTKIPLVSFHTCDILTTGATTGTWYQVYGKSTIPNNFDDDITNFVCEVVNYANDTNGADFAIDQLAIYTKTSKVQIKQSVETCDVLSTPTTRLFIDKTGLQDLYGTSGTATVYWRICDEDGNVVKGEHLYSETDDGTATYGQTVISDLSYSTASSENLASTTIASGWCINSDDNGVYYLLANRYLGGVLETGHTYYFSIYKPKATFSNESEGNWGGEQHGESSPCSVYSPNFVLQKQYVTYTDATGGNEGGNVLQACGSTETVVSDYKIVLKFPDINEPTGFVNVTTLTYDYAYCSLADWTSATATFTYNSTEYKYDDVRTALITFRTSNPTATSLTGYEGTGVDKLTAAVSAGVLELAASSTFTHTFASGASGLVTCLPIETQVLGNDICAPFELKFNIVSSSPLLTLGFSDISTYPSDYKRVIRIGLEQLANLRASDETKRFKLHIPIHSYHDGALTTTNRLKFNNVNLTLSASDDPTIIEDNLSGNTTVATIVDPEHGTDVPYVDADHQYLALDFSNCDLTFHEGYQYEITTQYYDEGDESKTGRCNVDLFLVIKVVPEFVTWNPAKDEDVVEYTTKTALSSYAPGYTDIYNINYNRDGNWLRSSRAELYKDDATTHNQNSVTDGHPERYQNNSEIDGALTASPAFVPMKFTYVTIPSDLPAPDLVKMDFHAYDGGQYTGGNLQTGTMWTNTCPSIDGLTTSSRVDGTNNSLLKYDMLVRYTETACQGHKKSDGTTILMENTANVYDCEKFYGNVCREIYFKPSAELINQHRLTYDKAWVEKELVPNTWYLMSSPLKVTYAGDMYVPTSMTDVTTGNTVYGRQVSEAFLPINFTDQDADEHDIYSRTLYPVYQRSWGKDATVYTSSEDVRSPSYAANIGFTSISSTIAEWGHVYNDVQVPYTNYSGFSIRANRKTMDNNALIRLPKSDESYIYFPYDDNLTDFEPVHEVDKVTDDINYIGKLLFDNSSENITISDQSVAGVAIPVTNLQSQGADTGGYTYYLVGNPFMASVDMGRFFNINPKFETTYYTYEASTLKTVDATAAPSATDKHIIKPLQAFFIKCKATEAPAPVNVIFTPDMMTDGNFEIGTQAATMIISSARAFTAPTSLKLSATNGYTSSSASIGISENASDGFVAQEDVETLFDSNLSNVPVIFTVAGNKAVSIDRRPSLDIVPFGVGCAASDELVEVSFTGTEAVGKELYVFDAATGESTSIGEGSTVEVVPNEYGRYFLTYTRETTALRDQLADGVRISVHNGTVSVTAAQSLGTVRALGINGSQVYHQQHAENSVTFSLPEGVYIIEADGPAGQRTTKILVK